MKPSEKSQVTGIGVRSFATHEEAEAERDRLHSEGKRAYIDEVRRMHLTGDPLAPKTANPWAVVYDR